jgi:hypothetical protein
VVVEEEVVEVEVLEEEEEEEEVRNNRRAPQSNVIGELWNALKNEEINKTCNCL